MTGKTLLLPLLAVVVVAGSAGSSRGGTASDAPAQEPETREERRRALLEGTHVFRRILHDHDFAALDDFKYLADHPHRTLLVVLGDLSVLAKVPGGLEAFVRRGGALLAASDRAVGGIAREQLLAVSGVTINEETLLSNDPQDCYQGLRYCPCLHPRDTFRPDLFHDSTAFGALRVYANVPSMLLFKRAVGNVTEVAGFPDGFWLVLGPGDRRLLPHPLTFAVGGELGAGRVLVLADHSVFINQMMLPRDTNNVEFSYNAVRWLQGERPRRRDRVLFVEDGQVQTRLDVPLKSVTLPPEELAKLLFAKRNELLVAAEETLTRLEDEDAFNRKLLEALESSGWPPERVSRVVVLVGSLVALVYLVYRLGVRDRFRHDATVPLLTATVARRLPQEPLLQQRQRALLERGNLGEPAAVLARRWFSRLGLDASSAAMPAFESTGGWWERWRRKGRLRRLWRLAAGRSPRRVTPAGLWRLQRELDELQAGWERGAWRIAS